MVRLALLLLGTDFIRSRWRTLVAIGVALGLMGAAIFIDALDGVVIFPIHLFGYVLVAEGAVALLVAAGPLPGPRALRYAKGVLFVVLGVLVINRHHFSVVLLALLFGLLFTVGGCLRIAAAWVVRFPGWRGSILAGGAELLLAAFIFEPWPTHYVGTVPYCLGVGLCIAGAGSLRLAWRLRRLPPGVSMAALLRDGYPPGGRFEQVAADAAWPPLLPMTVHVWTPLGSAQNAVRRPVVDRYIAAVDAQGVISTGHAALEMAPDVYISHYPAVEIDRSPDEFARTLRATAENDVPGRFQPDYGYEAANWCDSTQQVVFRDYSPARLRAFWQRYGEDTTYNLTYRNCSSTVVHALEAALEGVLARRGVSWLTFLRIMTSPELWVASQLNRRATTMAWTPGLVLDYVRALRGMVHPAPIAWVTLTRMTLQAYRRSRRRLAQEGQYRVDDEAQHV